MSRRSLRPQLNQIRTWVRQGRTDAWIAHTLQVTVQQLQSFKREQGLDGDAEEAGPAPEEIDLRAEDDAAIAAELEEEERKRAEEEERRRVEEEARQAEEAQRAAEEAARAAEEAERRAAAGEEEPEPVAVAPGDAADDDDDDARPRRRRRGGRRRRTGASATLEGTFDHGEEGYGLWLDPALVDNPVYAEHWAGHRPVEVTIEEDQIVIRRAGAGDDDDE